MSTAAAPIELSAEVVDLRLTVQTDSYVALRFTVLVKIKLCTGEVMQVYFEVPDDF